MGDRDEEVRHLRDLVTRIAAAAEAVLGEVEALDSIGSDAELRIELRRLIRGPIPALRLVTGQLTGDSHPGRGGTGGAQSKT
jgi:hypothetical protein